MMSVENHFTRDDKLLFWRFLTYTISELMANHAAGYMPDILDSKFKKHPILLWRILNDTCYIYEHKKELSKKDGDYSSYNCHGCAKEKKKFV
ncbi:unnamed protein product, partial [Mesorhabditis belari]|uniref:Uncharacterized protein n=1 Tax=Mesorhabditis belari TaxID=2138241 RepID=A0AAF3J7X1_9BILA